MRKLMVPTAILFMTLACNRGGGEAASEEPVGAADPTNEDEVSLTATEDDEDKPAQAANFDLTPLQCPMMSTYQIGRNEQGVEQWCDRNGVMHGPYMRWHLNGKRAVEGEYKENNPAKTWRWWHQNGEKESRGTYGPNGKQLGSWTWWHDNGERAQEGDFDQAGRKSGMWRSWHVNGMKAEEGFFVNGQKNGTWIFYSEEGERLKIQHFIHGVPEGDPEDEEQGGPE